MCAGPPRSARYQHRSAVVLVVQLAELEIIRQHPNRYNSEGEDASAGLKVAAEGFVGHSERDVRVELSVHDESVHPGYVGGLIGICLQHVLGRKSAVANLMDLVAAHGADGRKDYTVADVVLLDHLLEARQQIGLIFEAQDHHA